VAVTLNQEKNTTNQEQSKSVPMLPLSRHSRRRRRIPTKVYMKVVGRNNDIPLSPVDAVRKAERLICAANQLAQVDKPRGFVFKAKSYKLYEAWKKNQSNPRLW